MSPRVAMTLLVRDEAELVEQWLRYHYACGVDVVIATDHRSRDGTTDLLREEERAGRLHLIRRDDEVLRQAEWVTEMARLAATEHHADWVIHSDADEFWWPRGDSIKEILGAVAPRYGVVRGLWRNFVLRPGDADPFWERMTFRCRPSADLRTPYHAQVKVAHRAVPDAVVGGGNHDAYGTGLTLIREWMPFEVLHFPLRTRGQLEEKFLRRITSPEGAHIVEAIAGLEAADGGEAFVQSVSVGDVALAAGLESGDMIEDVRLRDALRALDAGATSLPAWIPSIADEVDLALDVEVMLRHDALVVLDRRAAVVQRAVDRIDALVSSRIGRRRARNRPEVSGLR